MEKRLDADVPVGFLLSGGLDHSLVCAIAAKLPGRPIESYAVGMSTDVIDLKYAKQVADYIGSNHREIYIAEQDVLDTLDELIYTSGPYDITTIRASMGMCLICKDIHGDVRVLLTGEISDELVGYKYTDLRLHRRHSKRNARSGSAKFICTMFSEQTGASLLTVWKHGCFLGIWTLLSMS